MISVEKNTLSVQPLLQVKDLALSIGSNRGSARILEGVSFELYRGEMLAVVGETGCGKSITAKSILNLLPHVKHQVSGSIFFDGSNLLALSPKQLQLYRGRRIAMIFQNPQSSINPVFTLGEQISRLIRMFLPDEIKEIQKLHGCRLAEAVRLIACEKLQEVGLTDAERLLETHAHQISGGMAQRYRIATALLGNPEMLIADEATSALDVTVQAHILKLLQSLCRRKGTAIMFITHDLGIAAQICDRIAVMYAGRIIETAPSVELFRSPLHPYTRGLLAAVPRFGREEPLQSIPGMIPDLADPPSGCRFHPRCPHVMEVCRKERPVQVWFDESHRLACHLYIPPQCQVGASAALEKASVN